MEVKMATTAVPQTAIWKLDPAHSSVEFAVKHMMMTTVRGRFKEVIASLTGDEQHPDGCCVEVEIQAASVDTGAPDRDAHLRGPDFFDTDNFPQIRFRSKRVEGQARTEGDDFKLIGDLTIRDTSMEITLNCTFEGRGNDPWGQERAGFSFKGDIDRRDWGLRWNQAIESGGILVAHRVKIEGEVQFVRQAG
jgi:polyisoprenoid-binding protein YceI